ncbi:hypothetical protein C8J57DRAFT_46489 [Mycena rebaudengoi]|nr:hypothetical protein C8J57DRAFT_46489 [Mycena rebaudengoi]
MSTSHPTSLSTSHPHPRPLRAPRPPRPSRRTSPTLCSPSRAISLAGASSAATAPCTTQNMCPCCSRHRSPRCVRLLRGSRRPRTTPHSRCAGTLWPRGICLSAHSTLAGVLPGKSSGICSFANKLSSDVRNNLPLMGPKLLRFPRHYLTGSVVFGAQLMGMG